MIQLTVGQIRKAARKNKYLLLRDTFNRLYGVNSKAMFMGNNAKKENNQITSFISFRGCSIHEYISHKTSFA
jgi:hypothetical protein